MEPLSLTSGIGKGDAQIFDKGLTTVQGLDYVLQEKRRREQEAKLKEQQKQKAVKDIYDNIDEVNVTGYLPHLNYLNNQKDSIRGYLTEQYTNTGGKYNPQGDPVVGKLVSNLKKENEMSNQIKHYAQQLPSMLTKENSKNYTDESVLEVDKFLKLPLNDQVKYVEGNGFPIPQPKPEMIDYDKNIDSIAKGLSEKTTTVEKTTPSGMTQTVSVSGFDPSNVDLYSKSYIAGGLDGRKPDAANLLVATRKKLDNDIVFQAMDEDAKQNKVIQEAEKYVKNRMMAAEGKKFSSTLQSSGSGSGKKNITVEDIKTDVPITRAIPKKEGKPETKVETAKFGVTLPSDITLNVPSTVGVLDTKTGKSLLAPKSSRLDTTPVPYTGQLELTGGGKLLAVAVQNNATGKSELKPMLFATATLVDKEGKTEKREVQIPLDQIRGEKILEGSAEALDEFQKRIDDYNKGKENQHFDYSKTGMESKSKELGITIDKLKKKILSKKPTATFE